MTYLKINQITAAEGKIMILLKKLGLDPDERMLKTLEENPEYINRLASLFMRLKKCNIKLNDTLHDLIASNVSCAGSLSNLLDFMHNEEIDVTLFPLARLFACAQSDTVLIQGMQLLKTRAPLDLTTLNLFFAYPAHSLLLADLIINFQQHAYPTEKIVEKLHKFSAKNMDTAIRLLTLLLNKNLYYFECFEVLSTHQEYIDKIYEGTLKLTAKNKLAASYFSVIENNPRNANVLANLILLLHKESLIDYRKTEDLSMVSKLEIGAFHFLSHLQQAGMLDSENYKKVCQDSSILTQKDVMESFINLPLFEGFDKSELAQMLRLISEPSSETNLEEFMAIIEKHQLVKNSSLKQ
ncbi:hypothetical protein [Legionella parisiensis]|uniref:Uncharacterized protein n=1 Tax=Legionella parisiensis TaxID=45071 RepID=A0A1E5JS06_9GAMM|nr:hypothetical protein [Legionella parisiensis]KTD40879.1 hypothetical protein Lpar_2196 [Legionella parisiensis]OEH47316.1 hypothetical protein lpari_01629 [Legionella parisiensis]STX72179.1 Uncharacterised protein [Legionella parisiensis]